MKVTRGWGPWGSRFYSICSKHYAGREDCALCQTGEWDNNWSQTLSSFVHDYCYSIWYWWQNGPMRKANLKRLQRWFPNLR